MAGLAVRCSVWKDESPAKRPTETEDDVFDKDELELNPESEEDLDVGEDAGENVAGGAGTIGLPGSPKPKPKPGLPGGGGPVGPPRPGPGGPRLNPDVAQTGGACTTNTPAQGCTACAGCE